MVELIVVLMIVGSLVAFAVLRFTGRQGQSLVLQTDQFRRDLSHAQMLAIGRSQRLKVSALGASYAVEACDSATCSNPSSMTNPSTGTAFVVSLRDGVTISSAAPLFLDSLGRPSSGSGVVATAPAATFRLTLSGRSTTVAVAPLTGFAQASY